MLVSDSFSGLPIIQLSDARKYGVPITVEYASVNCVSSSGRYTLLLHNDHFALYDTHGFLRELPMLSASCRPKWSRTEPDCIFYFHENQLRLLDVAATDVVGIIQQFEYTTIDDKGEADISEDGDHLVLIGDDRWVFVYQISSNIKSPVLDTIGHPVESLYITPSNGVLVSWLPNKPNHSGIELFDSNLVFQRRVLSCNGHKDVTRDPNGREVLVVTNSDENPITLPDFPNGIVSVDLETGVQTGLLAIGWHPDLIHHLAVHISTPGDGWAYVTTYAGTNPKPGTSEWSRLAGMILRVHLTTKEVQHLCLHRAHIIDYTSQPKASASRDGRVFFSSNDGGDVVNSYMLTISNSASMPTKRPPTLEPDDKAWFLEEMGRVFDLLESKRRSRS